MFRISLVSFSVFLFAEITNAEVEFNRDVRPILSDKCFACHGPDGNSREADLRLDKPQGATADRGGYFVISPGDLSASELVNRIVSHDAAEQMPPPEFNKPLTAEEIALLKQWIKEGAKWQDHWSFAPLTRPTLPENSQHASSPIDAAILQKLGDHNLVQAIPADPRTLIRRLTFDITGLPPTPEEVSAFEADHSLKAYEESVDRLLASPHFGERIAIYWLDLVRYADSLGYHGDQERSVSPYRDYVINAFNSNMPFDQFTIENLAGDLLPEPTLAQKVASTYNRLNRASAEGGGQPKEYLAKYVSDRVRTTGAVWLGTTIGCAECHDHKFDPFTTKDFYSLGAFFADIKELGIVGGANHIEQMPVPTSEQATQQAGLSEKIETLQQQYDTRTPELNTAFATWMQTSLVQEEWHVLTPLKLVSQSGTTLTMQDDGAILASGKNPDKETYTLDFATPLDEITALKLEILADDSLPQKGPGRAGNGNLVIHSVKLTAGDQQAKWIKAVATHSQGGFDVANLASGKKGWALLPETGKDHRIVLVAKEPLKLASTEGAERSTLTLTIEQNHGGSHSIGKFRVSVASQPVDAEKALASAELTELLNIQPTDRTPDQEQKLFNIFRNETPVLQDVRDELAKQRALLEQLKKSITTTLVTVSTQPREMRVLPRGDWMSEAGEVVLPAVPEFLVNEESSETSKERLDRLDLAQWMVSRENPLVARTFVNRLWMLYFGQGIARSVDDLGSQGEWPTHPELLDWLAVEFIDSGWDVKHIIKLMVMSHTYRQSSMPTPELRQRDPYNKLYARQSRWRLDAEMVRDNALAISDLLVDEIGGPSARPYQPAGYWGQLNFPKREYESDKMANQYRRGVYTHWQRTFLHPSLLAFDAPAREECTAKRDRSNTPLQALVLLNDPTYVEAARVFAQHIVEQGGETTTSRLNWSYRHAIQREPTPEETTLLTQLLDKQRAYYTEHPEEATQLVSTGLATTPKEATPEVAAWTSLTRAILNLHETITRY